MSTLDREWEGKDKIPRVSGARAKGDRVTVSVSEDIPDELQSELDAVAHRAVTGPLENGEMTASQRYQAIRAAKAHLLLLRDKGHLRRGSRKDPHLWMFDRESQVLEVDFRRKRRAV